MNETLQIPTPQFLRDYDVNPLPEKSLRPHNPPHETANEDASVSFSPRT